MAGNKKIEVVVSCFPYHEKDTIEGRAKEAQITTFVRQSEGCSALVGGFHCMLNGKRCTVLDEINNPNSFLGTYLSPESNFSPDDELIERQLPLLLPTHS